MFDQYRRSHPNSVAMKIKEKQEQKKKKKNKTQTKNEAKILEVKMDEILAISYQYHAIKSQKKKELKRKTEVKYYLILRPSIKIIV